MAKSRKWEAKKGAPKTYTLPDCECQVEIQGATGNDVMAAQRMASGDPALYMPALMSLTVKVDGESLLPEDFGLMSGDDFNFLMDILTGIKQNFTSAPKTS